jgi:hypothetical protein
MNDKLNINWIINTLKIIKMKSLKILMFAAVATILAACTKDDGSSVLTYDEVKSWEPVQISFDSFMGERAVTRAGLTGNMDTDAMKTDPSNGGGFGVFAYYTNGNGNTDGAYNPSTSTPNFMWNQLVEWNSSATTPSWSYSPIKYWPNETKSDGTNNATSQHADKLSFFAYAPYVSPTASSSDANNMLPFDPSESAGIISISDNAKAGDPLVEYKSDFTGLNSVDLLWGVSASATGSSVNATPYPNSYAIGDPYVDLVKQQTGGKINFLFKHALSRLALTVQAANNLTTAGGDELYDNTTANKTKIVIESVTLTAKFPEGGILDLNNTTTSVPNWISVTPSPLVNKTITIDGTSKNNLRKDLIYSSGETAANNPAGVITTSPKHLIADSSVDPTNAAYKDKYFMFIPSSDLDAITINIVYHVITDDTNLADDKIDVTNNITKVISVDTPATQQLFTAGNAYTFNLVLGVTSVDIDASVSPWVDSGNTQTVNLPINVE